MEIGNRIAVDDEEYAVVIEVDEESVVIEYVNGTVERVPLSEFEEEEVTETPEAKRRRENIAAGRHPLFVALKAAPADAAPYRRPYT